MAVAEGRARGDLPVRFASAAVMLAVAGIAFWQGGWWWAGFVVLAGLGVLWEWGGLVGGFNHSAIGRGLWNGAGIVYVGIGVFVLIALRLDVARAGELLALMVAVIATDIFAYFFGRTFGGPKIAPRISPSKTWSGLVGGIIGAAAVMVIAAHHQYYAQFEGLPPGGFREAPSARDVVEWQSAALVGACIALVAQVGDFFESWMKRRAGVKDSGTLLPGHGGLFDRVDGLLAVLFVSGALLVGRVML